MAEQKSELYFGCRRGWNITDPNRPKQVQLNAARIVIYKKGNDQELKQSDPKPRPQYHKGKKSQQEVTSVNK